MYVCASYIYNYNFILFCYLLFFFILRDNLKNVFIVKDIQ